jgi:Flp pilus assembly protein TadG
VEFAIIAPLLVLLALGIVEFGRAFQVEGTLSAAAREGVRVMALQNNQSTARSTAEAVASSLRPALQDSNITFSPASCPAVYTPGATVTMTITYREPFMTGLFGAGVTMTAKGVMRCNG